MDCAGGIGRFRITVGLGDEPLGNIVAGLVFSVGFGRGFGTGSPCFFWRFVGFKASSSSSSDVSSITSFTRIGGMGFFAVCDFLERILARSAMPNEEYGSSTASEKPTDVAVAGCMLSLVRLVAEIGGSLM